MVQSRDAMMEHPPCEIIQQQSQRYSHRGRTEGQNGWNKRDQSRQPTTHLVTTTRNTAIHEIPQKTRLNDNSTREDSTHVLLTQSCSLERQLRVVDQDLFFSFFSLFFSPFFLLFFLLFSPFFSPFFLLFFSPFFSPLFSPLFFFSFFLLFFSGCVNFNSCLGKYV